MNVLVLVSSHTKEGHMIPVERGGEGEEGRRPQIS